MNQNVKNWHKPEFYFWITIFSLWILHNNIDKQIIVWISKNLFVVWFHLIYRYSGLQFQTFSSLSWIFAMIATHENLMHHHHYHQLQFKLQSMYGNRNQERYARKEINVKLNWGSILSTSYSNIWLIFFHIAIHENYICLLCATHFFYH